MLILILACTIFAALLTLLTTWCVLWPLERIGLALERIAKHFENIEVCAECDKEGGTHESWCHTFE